MKFLKSFLLFIVFTFFFKSSFPQYFNEGQDRSSVNWKYIRTENFEVIFPEGFEDKGEHVARLLEIAYKHVPNSLDHKPKRVSVVLHTETVKSNAFLGWCPSRIEMYTTPHQGIYSQDWLEQLSIHEYRHLVQVSKLDDEMSVIYKYLLGEHGAALLSGFYLPFWFIEGDAVAVETGLSKSGRGRYPGFNREFRAQLVEKGKFSYDKAYLGSLKDNVPNHYSMGYLMVGGAREKFGKPVFNTVLNDIAKNPFYVTIFDRGLKKSIGLSTTELYDTIFNELTTSWRAADTMSTYTNNTPVTPNNKYFTNYTFAIRNADGNYLAYKSGLDDISRFVSISETGKEKVLFTPGYSFEESVSIKQNLIVWSERLPNIRWAHADKSILRIFDAVNNELSEFRFRSKLFAPAISPDFQKIVAVEADNNYRFYLTEINLKSGEVTNQYQSEGDDYFITPSYVDKNKVLTVLLRNNEKGIVLIDMKNKTEKVILPFKNQEIKRPVIHNGYVFFIGGYRGTDDLYALDTISKTTYKVVTSRFGITDYSFSNNSIVYSNYTSNGFRTVITCLDSITFLPVYTDTIKSWAPFAETLARQEGGAIDFSEPDTLNHNVLNYKKTLHNFNFHSWAPISIDPYKYTAYPGVSVMSQNMLSTTETVLGYRYKWEEKKSEFYVNYKYMGWFPIINVEANYGKARSYNYLISNYVNIKGDVENSDTVKNLYSWNEANVFAQLYVPLNFSKGNYYRYLYPSITYRFTHYDKDNKAPEKFPQGNVNSVEGTLRFYTMMHQSVQAIYPRWGVLFDFGYLHSLPGVLEFGQFAYGSGMAYIPGFFNNHGIKLYGGYQVKDQKDFVLTDRIRLPRGHQRVDNKTMISYGIDYKLPLMFPDLAIPRILFIKKIDFGVFYDQAILQYYNENRNERLNLRSAGAEVVFTTNFFRFFAPVEIGARASYLFDNSFKADFLFNISFTL